MEVVSEAEETHVLDVDPAQLVQLLASSEDGTAQFIDEQGNTITVRITRNYIVVIKLLRTFTFQLTAEQLVEAGITLETLEGAEVPMYDENSQYLDQSSQQYYVMEGTDQEPPQLEPEAPAKPPELVPADPDAENFASKPPVLSASVTPTSASQGPAGFDADLLKYPDHARAMFLQFQRSAQENELQRARLSRHVTLLVNALIKSFPDTDFHEIVVRSSQDSESRPQSVILRKTAPDQIAPNQTYQMQLDTGESRFVIVQDEESEDMPVLDSSLTPSKAVDEDGHYQCEHCSKRFNKEAQLKRHKDFAHAKSRTFFCRFCNCDLILPSEEIFQAHIRLQHTVKEEEPESVIAGSGGNDEDEDIEEEPDYELLDLEKANEESDQRLGEHKCNMCSMNYISALLLKRHMKEEHAISPDWRRKESSLSVAAFVTGNSPKKNEIPYMCGFCPKRFKWKSNFLKHKEVHNAHFKFTCNQCNTNFPSQAAVDVHFKSKHMERIREHVCPLCQKSFYEKESLTKHMREHNGPFYTCGQCGRQFVEEALLKKHITIHTETRHYVCNVCEKMFSRASSLSAHLRIHSGERAYKCKICERRFNHRFELKYHLRTHGDNFPFVCHCCGLRFREKDKLAIHKTVHKRNKLYQCSSCWKAFSKLEDLQMHVDGHRRIRHYPCLKCNRAYNSLVHLEKHMQVHATEQPYRCGDCGSSFKEKNLLEKHMKVHMPNDDMKYIILWEQNNMLKEAAVVADGVTQEMNDIEAMQIDLTQFGKSTTTTSNGNGASAPFTLQVNTTESDIAAQALNPNQPGLLTDAPADSGFDSEALKQSAASLQLVDENVHLVHTVPGGSMVVLQDGVLQNTNGGESTLDLAAISSTSTEDGTIYISADNLHVLTDPGMMMATFPPDMN
ncbi:Zinc finger protein [Trichinella pseudospiralis]|uniref:Zinc finger protein n=1 Tax=Trichinella pseudospiralis TaxID=6337 RepID=A0A0V1EN98_TRIPS|nr:Zinc finger protein [Trichinella pseudospiralis]